MVFLYAFETIQMHQLYKKRPRTEKTDIENEKEEEKKQQSNRMKAYTRKYNHSRNSPFDKTNTILNEILTQPQTNIWNEILAHQ